MKKFIVTVFAAVLAMCAMAQSVNVTEGKKWYDAERYDKALPYLKKAVAEGDVDSKARLACMIFTMQVPEYSMDRDRAMKMLDEAIDAGSVFAIERKGFCTLAMGNDTKEDKQKGVDLLIEASDKGSADASFNLFKVYRDGIKTYSDGEVCVAVDEAKALEYIEKAAEQNGLEGAAYLGWFILEGTHGYDKDVAEGADLILKAWNYDNRVFAGNCLEPGRALVNYLTSHGKATVAAPIKALLKKYHPTEY
ncbi:MAG: hypothetical protein MJZ74_09665 [Muribaculaceae bacterium]|nr:hypothetical protein [Muribaculaceae bacterium]